MVMLDSKITLLQEISDAAKKLEAILVTQFDKKLEGTLEADSLATIDYDKIGINFAKLKDRQVGSFTATIECKQATAEAKEHMNEKQVDLHDVMYEKRHILEEIVQCRKFRSVYQDVELIPLDEFMAKAGPEYLENSDNPHQLFINRLKYELVVRAALKEQQEELQLKRTQLIKENRKAQKKVDQYDKLLDDFVQSAAPLEEALEAERKAQNAPENEMITEQAQETTNTAEVMDTSL
ncbi:fms interacting protein [Mucor ambiguus]|uniref:Fms interacting protein n=1 Tax=Mucor ambiguus TaxID=91626 RepID=A0A0C9MKD6_9FUNG|nr:fms interacting protein [Mucor ambiguus]